MAIKSTKTDPKQDTKGGSCSLEKATAMTAYPAQTVAFYQAQQMAMPLSK